MDKDRPNTTTDVNEMQGLVGHECGMHLSPLNTIPPELRDSIWELIFDDLWETTKLDLLSNRKCAGGHKNLALLLTCRLIYEEAGGVAWANVKATIGDEEDSVGCPRDGDPTLEDIISAREEVKAHLDLLVSQLGPKLGGVSELVCRHEGVLRLLKGACWKDVRVSEPSSPLLDFLPQLTGIRQVSLSDGDLWQQFDWDWKTYLNEEQIGMMAEASLTSKRWMRHFLSRLHNIFPRAINFTLV
ncbi:hypothetical protein B0A48_10793 [Cryoendolithus antarcticus]|uniref:Uncharacterized protein n=1 Tax=Cryoendolithus antarcticus TaxID=1507870 RepID=A0A1V8SYF6_9PEZI|nr:hypothetical protein B0A48_10793 [Cryoendolithus antarcticus]